MKKLLVINAWFTVMYFYLYLLPYTLYPAFAAVDLKDIYAFSGFESLGDAVRILVIPGFSIAGVLVVFYFLIGALKYIASRGDKSQLEAARNMMTHAAAGFIILIVIFFVMQFLSETFSFIPNII